METEKIKVRTQISEKGSEYLHTLANKYGLAQRHLISALVEALACGCLTEGFMITKAYELQQETPKRGRPAKNIEL
jgi:hypothetical protein